MGHTVFVKVIEPPYLCVLSSSFRGKAFRFLEVDRLAIC
jgi:hypothetical protein